jgi:hypothetical protein
MITIKHTNDIYLERSESLVGKVFGEIAIEEEDLTWVELLGVIVNNLKTFGYYLEPTVEDELNEAIETISDKSFEKRLEGARLNDN